MPTVKWVFFPLDRQLQLGDVHWSEGVARLGVWLSGQATFGAAADILEQVGQIHVSKSSVWRQAKHWGEAFQAAEEQHAEQVQPVPSREEISPGEAKNDQRLGVGLDGAKVYVLTEGWKEFKVGCVYEVEARPTFSPATLEWETLGHAVRNTYVTHLGDPAGFGPKVWAEAHRRHWTQAWETQVVGDGAPWIWNLAADHFYDSYQVVDWYHATQHLASAATAVYGDQTSPAQQRWSKDHTELLFQGHADQVAHRLRCLADDRIGQARQSLLEEAGYFEHNQHRMNYLELREDGWLIGSGMVESGAKQFKHRFTGAGMRWSRPGAERLMPIRPALLSRTFDSAWREVYCSPNT